MSANKLQTSKLTLYEHMSAYLSNSTGLCIPSDAKAQQKFIDDQAKMTYNKQFTESQRKAATYLYSRIKDVSDPYLKLEVCKINEVVNRKYQPSSTTIMQGASDRMQLAITRVESHIRLNETPTSALPRVNSNISMAKSSNVRKTHAAQQIFQDFVYRGGGTNKFHTSMSIAHPTNPSVSNFNVST